MRTTDLKRFLAYAINLILIFAVAPAVGVMLTPAAPAQADVRGTIWVDARVSGAWPIASAVRYVEPYTGTTMRLGPCHTGTKCIVIRERASLPAAWGAVTYIGYPLTTIALNPRRRGVSAAQRYHIVVHELGHANGIMTHARSCTSIMYYNVHCPSGQLAPMRFSAAELATLRGN